MPDPRKPRRPRPSPAPIRERGGEREATRKRHRSPRDRGRARSLRRDISDVRKLNPTEREIVVQVGRFRTIDIHDFKLHLPQDVSAVQMVRNLKELGLVRSHYVQAPAQRDARKRDACAYIKDRNAFTKSQRIELIVLTHKGAEWLRVNGYDETVAGKLRPGFGKQREAFHDAHLYSMTQREINVLRAQGATNFQVLTDSAIKQHLYTERARLIAEGRSRDEAHVEAAAQFDIPLSDGKFTLPDVRLEYDMADGTRHSCNLELITDTYRASHIAAKNAAGFLSYALNKAGNMERGSGQNGGGRPWDEDWMARSMSR